MWHTVLVVDSGVGAGRAVLAWVALALIDVGAACRPGSDVGVLAVASPAGEADTLVYAGPNISAVGDISKLAVDYRGQQTVVLASLADVDELLAVLPRVAEWASAVVAQVNVRTGSFVLAGTGVALVDRVIAELALPSGLHHRIAEDRDHLEQAFAPGLPDTNGCCVV